MCGISGYISRQRRPPISFALQAMRHRGPDANGIHEETLGDFLLGLGHVRLSILDLTEAANQPFVSPCNNYVLVFNGEIYNHNKLRTRLKSLGVAFRTRSDTEVLLQAYIVWGADCVTFFDGMFAFAILDRKKAQLFCARDQFGIKPLYFRCRADSGELQFASEIRGLVALAENPLTPDPASFGEFLLNGFLYEPRTGIKGVDKLAAGETLTFNLKNGEATRARYYDPLSQVAENSTMDAEPALVEAMSLQTLADVPLGLFFSGGIDSSALAALSPHPLNGLFMDYSSSAKTSGDAAYAVQIAKKLGLELEVMRYAAEEEGAENTLAGFRQVARGTEEPISDYTYVASEQLSSLARERGYKVMLSGMGGDELFAGYPRHLMARYRAASRAFSGMLQVINPWVQRYPGLSKKADRLSRYAAQPSFLRAYTSLVGYFSEAEVTRLLGTASATAGFLGWLDTVDRKVGHLPPLKQAMYLDRSGFLAHNLTVTDRSSMSQSIEVRVPFLTTRLADYGFSLTDSQLLGLRGGKRPIRGLLRHHLPASLLDRRKEGFNPPLDGKIARLGPTLILDCLKQGPLADVVDMEFVATLVQSHFSGKTNQTYKLWQLLYFNEWLAIMGKQH